MKKVLLVLLCVFVVFPMSACRENNAEPVSTTSSDAVTDDASVNSKSTTSTSRTDKHKTTGSSAKRATSTSRKSTPITKKPSVDGKTSTTTTERKPDTTKKPTVQDSSYEDIACVKTADYQQVGFSVKSSNMLIRITVPEQWEFEKSQNGYAIVKNSQIIGNVVVSEESPSKESVTSEMEIGDVDMTHSVDRVASGKESAYTRTICYTYADMHGNNENLILTVAYQEIDTSAVYKMMMEVKKSVSLVGSNESVLPIRDNRNSILILGNSFVNTSSIGGILQTMCGSNVSVQAQSRGYASVITYAQDSYMLQSIRSGNYSVVFMCGIYSYNDVVELAKIIDACAYSNTKLAIFPAHNESRSMIDSAVLAYPNVMLIDWKAEIDALISTGIDTSNFCIADAHKHSTPLAGYVGAHMIYRAVFNKVPQTISFGQVPQWQIALLGDYVTKGSTALFGEIATYIIG